MITQLLLRGRISCLLPLLAMLVWVSAASAASVTKQVYINFDGSLSGTTYNLGAGEIDNSGTFSSSGSATVAGGVGDVPGDTDATSGFYFDAGITGLGITLTTTNWVSEAIVSPSVPVADQPNHDAADGGARDNHVLDVQGDTFYRFQGEDPNVTKITEFGYWDGGTEQRVQTPNPVANKPNHMALVWDAANTSLEAFLNGKSQGTVDLNAFDVSSPYVGYGFFARYIAQPGVGPRAMDGQLGAVAFSTYDGTFDPASDFQLPVVPEPTSVVMLAMALAALLRLRRR